MCLLASSAGGSVGQKREDSPFQAGGLLGDSFVRCWVSRVYCFGFLHFVGQLVPHQTSCASFCLDRRNLIDAWHWQVVALSDQLAQLGKKPQKTPRGRKGRPRIQEEDGSSRRAVLNRKAGAEGQQHEPAQGEPACDRRVLELKQTHYNPSHYQEPKDTMDQEAARRKAWHQTTPTVMAAPVQQIIHYP